MAEAISFRRGTRKENEEFIGVQGEIVVDLGDEGSTLASGVNTLSLINKQYNGAPTIRVHTGNNMPGGVILARADMANVDTRTLGARDNNNADCYHTGPNLTYEHLGNIIYERAYSEIVQGVLGGTKDNNNYLNDNYNIAFRDTTNINTTDLADNIKHADTERQGKTGNKPLAYRDTTNINTADLVDDTLHDGNNGNKPLAYKDTSNINTKNLANGDIHNGTDGNKPLAYLDMSNVNTESLANGENEAGKHLGKNLAYADLQNVNNDTIAQKLNNTDIRLEKYELVENKVSSSAFLQASNIDNVKFPTTMAVKDYVDNTEESLRESLATRSLDNITDWTIASLPGTQFEVKAILDESQPGNGYKVGDEIQTDVTIETTNGVEYVKIIVEEIDGTEQTGPIKKCNVSTNTNTAIKKLSPVTYTDAKGAKFTIAGDTETNIFGGGLMTNTMSNALHVTNDYCSSFIGYDGPYTFQYNGKDYERILPTLTSQDLETKNNAVINCTYIAAPRVNQNGNRYTDLTPAVKMATRDGDGDHFKAIFITKEAAYVCSQSWDFQRDNIIATLGYCDEKQNTQNINNVSGTTIKLNNKDSIYHLVTSSSGVVSVTIDTSSLTLANNQAKTFEVYIEVGAQLPTTNWIGIDAWMVDSEQSPLMTDATSVFAIRVQNINGVKKVIANYGGAF